jgi:hypothetical protein
VAYLVWVKLLPQWLLDGYITQISRVCNAMHKHTKEMAGLCNRQPVRYAYPPARHSPAPWRLASQTHASPQQRWGTGLSRGGQRFSGEPSFQQTVMILTVLPGVWVRRLPVMRGVLYSVRSCDSSELGIPAVSSAV